MSAERFRQWLEQAAQDLAVAQLVFREGYFSHACFLAQQSLEKTLKGYLLWASKHLSAPAQPGRPADPMPGTGRSL